MRCRRSCKRGRDDQDHVEVLRLPGLHQQRDVLDDHRVRGGGLAQAGGLGAHQRVHDRVQLFARGGVLEHQRAQGRAVKRPVGGEDAGPERGDDRREPGGPGLHDGPCDGVGVDEHRAEFGQLPRDGGFSCGDPACQTNIEHVP